MSPNMVTDSMMTYPAGRRLAAALAVCLAVAACDDRVAAGTHNRPPQVAAVTPSVPFYLDPAEDCGFLQAFAFSDPVALVRTFVAYDHGGTFLESTVVMDSVYVCPNHLPGPDVFSVVRSSTVELLSKTDSQASVLVRSNLLGRMSQDSVGLIFIRDSRPIIDTFVVLNTPFGWRILSPQLPDRVLESTLVTHPERFKLRPMVLDSLMRSRSRPDT